MEAAPLLLTSMEDAYNLTPSTASENGVPCTSFGVIGFTNPKPTESSVEVGSGPWVARGFTCRHDIRPFNPSCSHAGAFFTSWERNG